MNDSAQIYIYSRCSTCRKALNWLKEHQIEYHQIDIIQSPPSKEIMKTAISQLGDIKKLINTNGISYSEKGAAFFKTISDSEILDALYSDGKLIKRPFFVSKKGDILVGFKPDLWSQTLLN